MITVYAAAAFVILELVSIIVDPLRLPEWTLTLIIVVLCVGFIIAVILSWVYDVTPEGLKKTELATDAKATVVIEKAAKKRLKLSDIAIAVLLVLVLILAYPKIFNGGGNLKAMTHTATFINEFGIEETRQVIKEKYVQKLMILPFQAEETDTINSWLKYGIPEG
ncbi:hypothetical protein MUO66_02830, partial [Candidatus Bathyarchaeota archaeon]|nr:hypothetical protein [Candidatus Bathyarchaeota archaeon]